MCSEDGREFFLQLLLKTFLFNFSRKACGDTAVRSILPKYFVFWYLLTLLFTVLPFLSLSSFVLFESSKSIS